MTNDYDANIQALDAMDSLETVTLQTRAVETDAEDYIDKVVWQDAGTLQMDIQPMGGAGLGILPPHMKERITHKGFSPVNVALKAGCRIVTASGRKYLVQTVEDWESHYVLTLAAAI